MTTEELRKAQAEIERLKTRVGWLDYLDTEEGRKAHANEALLVENEQLKASLKEASKLLGGLASVCNYAHHGKRDRHSPAEQCPVEKRIDALLEKIKKYSSE